MRAPKKSKPKQATGASPRNGEWKNLRPQTRAKILKTLRSLPEARPEAAARAKKLARDPAYPSPHAIGKTARRLAKSFSKGRSR